MTIKKATRADLEAGDITKFVLAANEGPTSDKLAYYHHLGLFRVVARPDEDFSFADLCGDCFNPEVNKGISAAQLDKEKRALRSRVSREGVWGVILQGRESSDIPWEDTDQLDSLWGNIGADFIGSGYDAEFLSSALAWLEENKVTETDPQAALVAASKKALLALRALCAKHPDLASETQPYCKLLFDALDPYDPRRIDLGASPTRQTEPVAPLRFDGHGLNLNTGELAGTRFATLSEQFKSHREQSHLGAEILDALNALGAVLLKY